MWAKLIAVVAIAGCNQVFDLEATTTRDSSIAFFDAPPLIVPRDGSMTCPSPPDFETWTYQPHAVDGATTIEHATFLTDDRVVFAGNDHLYESSLAGPPTQIAELDLGDGAILKSPSASVPRSVFWFQRFQFNAGGVYVATHDTGAWTQQRAEIGDGIAYQVQPGTVGDYNGSLRMVFAEQATTDDKLRLVEIESHDGEHWSSLATLPWSTGTTVHEFDPSLSVDGCLLLFRRITPATQLLVASRAPDGTFSPPVQLVAAAGSALNLGYPTLDPSRTRLWFVRDNQLFEGRP